MSRRCGYELVRSSKRKKTITLTIKKDGRLVIHAPDRVPRSEIDGFFEKKRSWLERKLAEAEKEKKTGEEQRQFLPGERFFYLGDCYSLEVGDVNGTRQPLTLSHGTFLLSRNSLEGVRHCFVRWYREKARAVLAERVEYWSKRVQFFPKGITITGALHRYGSCSARDRLSFTWRIMMAPLEVIDYVIIHELAHIKEKNHSKRFWDLVEGVLPDYRQRKLWLQKNDHLLHL